MTQAASLSRPAGRRSTAKRNRVVETLRREILTGKLAPGDQVPVQTALARRFAVSSVTVQLALNRLAREGFIETHHRRGTFVVEKPPHLNHYALVFWNDPDPRFSSGPWTRYNLALSNEALALQRQLGCRIQSFYGIDQHADNEDRQRLLAHIESHRLAGLIFVNMPERVAGTPILDFPGLPRVALMSSQFYLNVPAVAFHEHWLERALDYLVAQGRQRIALLLFGTYLETDAMIDRLAAERGLTIPPHWRQIMPSLFPPAIRNCVRLLVHGAGAERPDALVIADDNFVEDAQAALVAAQVRVPKDLAVVAHCNFPWPPANVLPFKRLGYDTGEALRSCIDLIDRQRRGERVPGLSRIPALFEEEFQVARRASALARTPPASLAAGTGEESVAANNDPPTKGRKHAQDTAH